jgi:hypothetical protein
VVLTRGVWYVHRFAKKGRSLALRQTLGQVTVMRPGRPDSAETGNFHFDVHRAGDGTSAHERGHTVHPAQWSAFIALARDQAKRCFGARWQRAVIPYVLLD